MKRYELGEMEAKFAELVWGHAPIPSGELVKLCGKELNWKKPTTYTVLRKLCQRGIFQNEDAVVRVCISREEFYARQSHSYVKESFGGSLPKFLTAFMGEKKLTEQEAEELKRLIDQSRGE